MARPSKGSRLYLRPARRDNNGNITHKSAWVIRDGEKEIFTGALEDERESAEEALKTYKARTKLEITIEEILAHFVEHAETKRARPEKARGSARRLLRFFGGKFLYQINGDMCNAYIIQSKGREVASRDLQDLSAAIGVHAKAGLHTGYIIPREMRRQNAPEQKEARGHIYFVRSGDFVKIGFASDVQKRLVTLRTDHHGEIVLLHSVKGDRADEAFVHRLFADYRHKGEWFRLEGRLAGFLKLPPTEMRAAA